MNEYYVLLFIIIIICAVVVYVNYRTIMGKINQIVGGNYMCLEKVCYKDDTGEYKTLPDCVMACQNTKSVIKNFDGEDIVINIPIPKDEKHDPSIIKNGTYGLVIGFVQYSATMKKTIESFLNRISDHIASDYIKDVHNDTINKLNTFYTKHNLDHHGESDIDYIICRLGYPGHANSIVFDMRHKTSLYVEPNITMDITRETHSIIKNYFEQKGWLVGSTYDVENICPMSLQKKYGNCGIWSIYMSFVWLLNPHIIKNKGLTFLIQAMDTIDDSLHEFVAYLFDSNKKRIAKFYYDEIWTTYKLQNYIHDEKNEKTEEYLTELDSLIYDTDGTFSDYYEDTIEKMNSEGYSDLDSMEQLTVLRIFIKTGVFEPNTWFNLGTNFHLKMEMVFDKLVHRQLIVDHVSLIMGRIKKDLKKVGEVVEKTPLSKKKYRTLVSQMSPMGQIDFVKNYTTKNAGVVNDILFVYSCLGAALIEREEYEKYLLILKQLKMLWGNGVTSYS